MPSREHPGEQLAAKLQCACATAPISRASARCRRSPAVRRATQGVRLFDFQLAHATAWSDLMKPVVAKMTAEDLVNISAYVASEGAAG